MPHVPRCVCVLFLALACVYLDELAHETLPPLVPALCGKLERAAICFRPATASLWWEGLVSWHFFLAVGDTYAFNADPFVEAGISPLLLVCLVQLPQTRNRKFAMTDWFATAALPGLLCYGCSPRNFVQRERLMSQQLLVAVRAFTSHFPEANIRAPLPVTSLRCTVALCAVHGARSTHSRIGLSGCCRCCIAAPCNPPSVAANLDEPLQVFFQCLRFVPLFGRLFMTSSYPPFIVLSVSCFLWFSFPAFSAPALFA